MQRDMHYYGTYAMARLAGICHADAEEIAQAAQWVDDQSEIEVLENKDGSGIVTIPTAHGTSEAGARSLAGGAFDDARRIWVPFHFLPGNEGDTFAERTICRKNSNIAQKMLDHYLESPMARNGFGLQLAGIAAHVYADTFAHYGFTGFKSALNSVHTSSISIVNHNIDLRTIIKDALLEVTEDLINLVDLGHGSVETLPDQPAFQWKFEYRDGRSSGVRDNPATFLEGCQALHQFFIKFARIRYGQGATTPIAFPVEAIKSVLSHHLPMEGREDVWRTVMKSGALGFNDPCRDYDAKRWAAPTRAEDLANSSFYKFHAAADYHRSYVLRFLLPSFGLIVA